MTGRHKDSESYQAWYRSRRWASVRQQQLSAHPYCQCPHHEGQCIPADVVDHKQAHKGDARMFWDTRNLQSMTKQCHDSFKQSQERGGYGFGKGSDEHGMPLVAQPGWSHGTRPD
jgi:5-methylcytosine-specific restriction protein A